tara:strand:- start:137 stop:451 length:315 start_codon:yes stop_codon:yes gene_type:complete
MLGQHHFRVAVEQLTDCPFNIHSDDLYENIQWLDDTKYKPTKEEVEAKLIEVIATWEANKYQRDRYREYPEYGAQLDYIYHNGIEKWKTDIVDPVKAKYPKPSS